MFYHTWIYEYILNSKWLIRTVFYGSLVLNILAPIIIWYIMNSKPMPLIRKLTKKQRSKQEQNAKKA